MIVSLSVILLILLILIILLIIIILLILIILIILLIILIIIIIISLITLTWSHLEAPRGLEGRGLGLQTWSGPPDLVWASRPGLGPQTWSGPPDLVWASRPLEPRTKPSGTMRSSSLLHSVADSVQTSSVV